MGAGRAAPTRAKGAGKGSGQARLELEEKRERARPNGQLRGASRARCSLVRVLWRALRDRGRGRAWLAEAIGVSVSTLDGWRSGKRAPRLQLLERAFRALDMDVIAVPRPRDLRRTINRVEQGVLL